MNSEITTKKYYITIFMNCQNHHIDKNAKGSLMWDKKNMKKVFYTRL